MGTGKKYFHILKRQKNFAMVYRQRKKEPFRHFTIYMLMSLTIQVLFPKLRGIWQKKKLALPIFEFSKHVKTLMESLSLVSKQKKTGKGQNNVYNHIPTMGYRLARTKSR